MNESFNWTDWLVGWLVRLIIAVAGALLFKWRPWVGVGYVLYMLHSPRGAKQ